MFNTAVFLMDIPRRPYCIEQGALLSVVGQPGWERSLGESGHMYVCGQVPLLFT